MPMKTGKMLLTLLLFALMAGIVGCDDKDDGQVWETTSKKIEYEKDGLFFEFCLLNEQGEPATVFDREENFRFYFSIKNGTGRDLFYDAYTIAYINDFFRVISSSQQDMGKSYNALPQEDIGIGGHPFNDGDIFVFEMPWLHAEESVFKGGSFSFESIQQNPLEAGNYFTSFIGAFKVDEGLDGGWIDFGQHTFRINFRIK